LIDPILGRNKVWRERLHPLQRRAGVWAAAADPTPGLLLRGAELEEAVRWALTHPHWLSPKDQEFLQASRDHSARPSSGLGTNIEDFGWGVIFARDADPAVRDALRPLLEHRRAQATQEWVDFYREFDGPLAYAPGETAGQFLARQQGPKAGLTDWSTVPYYLLIVGDPEVIPFEFQYALSASHAVGRLHFEDPGDYRLYARSVVEAESGQFALPRRAAVFAPAHPTDPATRMSSRTLADPLLAKLRRDYPNWTVQGAVRDQARKAQLARMLGGDQTPALLFVAGRGAQFQPDDPLQETDQGAILCQDWPGVRRPGPDHYFGAADVGDDARLLGLIAFLFVPYGAGVSDSSDFAFLDDSGPGVLVPPADRPFLTRLARRLLGHPRGGALAVIGHVDMTWGFSFLNLKGEPDSGDFEGTLKRLLEGCTVGTASRFLVMRHGRFESELAKELRAVTYYDKPKDDRALSNLLTATLDARNYVILGDPAVRLPLGPGPEVADRPTLPTGVLIEVEQSIGHVAVGGRVIGIEIGRLSPPSAEGAPTEETVIVNGVDGDTGEYLLPPMTPPQVSAMARGDLRDIKLIKLLRKYVRTTEQPSF
jgi:hypothetical protein